MWQLLFSCFLDKSGAVHCTPLVCEGRWNAEQRAAHVRLKRTTTDWTWRTSFSLLHDDHMSESSEDHGTGHGVPAPAPVADTPAGAEGTTSAPCCNACPATGSFVAGNAHPGYTNQYMELSPSWLGEDGCRDLAVRLQCIDCGGVGRPYARGRCRRCYERLPDRLAAARERHRRYNTSARGRERMRRHRERAAQETRDHQNDVLRAKVDMMLARSQL